MIIYRRIYKFAEKKVGITEKRQFVSAIISSCW